MYMDSEWHNGSTRLNGPRHPGGFPQWYEKDMGGLHCVNNTLDTILCSIRHTHTCTMWVYTHHHSHSCQSSMQHFCAFVNEWTLELLYKPWTCPSSKRPQSFQQKKKKAKYTKMLCHYRYLYITKHASSAAPICFIWLWKFMSSVSTKKATIYYIMTDS